MFVTKDGEEPGGDFKVAEGGCNRVDSMKPHVRTRKGPEFRVSPVSFVATGIRLCLSYTGRVVMAPVPRCVEN